MSSSSGNPAATASGWRSGRTGSGRPLSLASARSLPLWISGRLDATPSMMKSTLPDSRPCTTSALPL